MPIAERIICEGNYLCIKGIAKIHLAKLQPIRNKIDLADRSQIRTLKKRLHIFADELQSAVGKVGNSIAVVSKELQQKTPATDVVAVQIETLPRSEATETLR